MPTSNEKEHPSKSEKGILELASKFEKLSKQTDESIAALKESAKVNKAFVKTAFVNNNNSKKDGATTNSDSSGGVVKKKTAVNGGSTVVVVESKKSSSKGNLGKSSNSDAEEKKKALLTDLNETGKKLTSSMSNWLKKERSSLAVLQNIGKGLEKSLVGVNSALGTVGNLDTFLGQSSELGKGLMFLSNSGIVDGLIKYTKGAFGLVSKGMSSIASPFASKKSSSSESVKNKSAASEEKSDKKKDFQKTAAVSKVQIIDNGGGEELDRVAENTKPLEETTTNTVLAVEEVEGTLKLHRRLDLAGIIYRWNEDRKLKFMELNERKKEMTKFGAGEQHRHKFLIFRWKKQDKFNRSLEKNNEKFESQTKGLIKSFRLTSLKNTEKLEKFQKKRQSHIQRTEREFVQAQEARAQGAKWYLDQRSTLGSGFTWIKPHKSSKGEKFYSTGIKHHKLFRLWVKYQILNQTKNNKNLLKALAGSGGGSIDGNNNDNNRRKNNKENQKRQNTAMRITKRGVIGDKVLGFMKSISGVLKDVGMMLKMILFINKARLLKGAVLGGLLFGAYKLIKNLGSMINDKLVQPIIMFVQNLPKAFNEHFMEPVKNFFTGIGDRISEWWKESLVKMGNLVPNWVKKLFGLSSNSTDDSGAADETRKLGNRGAYRNKRKSFWSFFEDSEKTTHFNNNNSDQLGRRGRRGRTGLTPAQKRQQANLDAAIAAKLEAEKQQRMREQGATVLPLGLQGFGAGGRSGHTTVVNNNGGYGAGSGRQQVTAVLAPMDSVDRAQAGLNPADTFR